MILAYAFSIGTIAPPKTRTAKGMWTLRNRPWWNWTGFLLRKELTGKNRLGSHPRYI